MSPSSARQQWLDTLPWLVGLVAVGPLVPLVWIVFASLPLAPFSLFQLALNLPVALWLLGLASDCARRARSGQPVPPIRLAVVVGAALGMLGLLVAAILLARTATDMPIVGIMLLWMTPLGMPPAALLGAGLAAGFVWLQQRPPG
jgi:hypothetical protein